VSASERPAAAFEHALPSGVVPWTSERFDVEGAGAADEGFTFAIVSDLNAGERADIFKIAVQQLALLRPELIMSVGDLIDGVSTTPEGANAEWNSFDERAGEASAPLFRVSGNHDATAQMLRDTWIDRYGALYYHFVYKNVLFLVLDTEDYPSDFRTHLRAIRDSALAVLRDEGRQAYSKTEYFALQERRTGGVGPEQSQYFQRVIAEHPDVRWTMLFMHKPIWRAEDPEFIAIETALAGRGYSVFGGHVHSFSHEIRHGRDYTLLGTTGGRQNPADDRAFDQVTLVTVKGKEPSIAHLRMDGILDPTGHIPLGGDTLCFQASRCGGGR